MEVSVWATNGVGNIFWPGVVGGPNKTSIEKEVAQNTQNMVTGALFPFCSWRATRRYGPAGAHRSPRLPAPEFR